MPIREYEKPQVMKALFERFDRSHRSPSPRLSQRTNFPSQPRPLSSFRAQFELALQDYERQTGINLVDHPLAMRLQGCHTTGDVVDILREQAQGNVNFHGDHYNDGDGRLVRSLHRTVYDLYRLFIRTELGEVINLVRQRMQMGLTYL